MTISNHTEIPNDKNAIQMTFGEALEITQATYHYFDVKDKNKREEFYREINSKLEERNQKIAERNKLNEEIDKLNKEIENISNNNLTNSTKAPDTKNFVLYDLKYNKGSNFSGLTYIYDNGNTVNVAIACRGSVELFPLTEESKKDWWHNNFKMLCKPNTDSDKVARDYAKEIFAKIKNQFSDKQINVITLGHSKGGREAQKQMLALLKKDRNNKKVNICCFTFNSAPICKFDKDISKHNNYCQNLILTDSLGIFKDILNLFDKYKYGKECLYHNDKNIELLKLVFFTPIAVIVSYILILLIDSLNTQPIYNFILSIVLVVIIGFATIYIISKYKNTAKLFLFSSAISSTIISTTISTHLRILANLELSMTNILTILLATFIIHILMMIVAILHRLHSISFFKDATSYYYDLRKANINEIIALNDGKELLKKAKKACWEEYSDDTQDKISKYLQKEYKQQNIDCSDYILLNIFPRTYSGNIIYQNDGEIVLSVNIFYKREGKGFKTWEMIKVYKKSWFEAHDLVKLKTITKDKKVKIKCELDRKDGKIKCELKTSFKNKLN